jgi:hypothetical protein
VHFLPSFVAYAGLAVEIDIMEPLRIASATNTWSNFMESSLRNKLFYSRIEITPYEMPCQLTTNPSITQI